MKVMREGQCLKHALYGIGVATTSNEERTTIDFYEHGRKIFVTQLLEAELVAEAPPRAPKPRGGGASRAQKKSAGTT
jgi:hypothetical protein